MSLLSYKKKLLPGVKPSFPVRFNKSHPLADKFENAYCFLPNSKLSIDLIGNRDGIVTDPTKVKQTPRGIDFLGGTSVTSRFDLGEVTASNPLSLQNPATIIMRVKIDAASVYDRLIDKSDGGNAAHGWAIGQNTGTSEIWLIMGAWFAQAKVDFVVGEWLDLYIKSSGTQITFGTRTQSDVTATMPESTTTNAALGNWNHSTTDRMTDGQVEYLHIFNDKLTDEQIVSVWDDPYKIAEPVNPPVYFIAQDVGTTDDLLADNVESASEVSIPAIGQTHALSSVSVESASEVSTPSIGQMHALTAVSVESASELSAPALTEIVDGVDNLFAENVESLSEVSTPSLGQIHVLTAVDVESQSEVSIPTLVQVGSTVECTLVSRTGTALPNLSALSWAWFDHTDPVNFIAPTDTGEIESTDASGLISVDIPNTTLTAGQQGTLVLRSNDGTLAGAYNLEVA